jgi:hypothetical protein
MVRLLRWSHEINPNSSPGAAQVILTPKSLVRDRSLGKHVCTRPPLSMSTGATDQHFAIFLEKQPVAPLLNPLAGWTTARQDPLIVWPTGQRIESLMFSSRNNPLARWPSRWPAGHRLGQTADESVSFRRGPFQLPGGQKAARLIPVAADFSSFLPDLPSKAVHHVANPGFGQKAV